jgi:hypothetical protein
MKFSSKTSRDREMRQLNRQLMGVSIISLLLMIFLYTGFVAA